MGQGRGRPIGRGLAVACGLLAFLFLLAGIYLDAAYRALTDTGTVVAAVRGSGVRERGVQLSEEWLRPRLCRGFGDDFTRYCKPRIRPLLEREMSQEWADECARLAHRAAFAFLDDGRDRVLFELGGLGKRIRLGLWGLWDKAGPRKAPLLLPPRDLEAEYYQTVAKFTAEIPDRVSLGWLASAERSKNGQRLRTHGDDPDAAGRSPWGRTARTVWRWVKRAHWLLPAAALLLLAATGRLVRGWAGRLASLGLVLAAAGGAAWMLDAPLRDRAHEFLARRLSTAPPPASRRPLGPDAELLAGQQRARDAVVEVIRGTATGMADAVLRRVRTPARVVSGTGAALLLAALVATRPWRRLRRRGGPARSLDSIPPVVMPQPAEPAEGGSPGD